MRAIGHLGLRAALLAGLVATGALTGCGGGQPDGHKQLADACVAEGEVPETCECIVNAMESKLSPDLFKRTVVAVAREKRNVGDFILSLPDDEKMEFFHAEQEMEKCNLTDHGDE